jgi:hypothetical protein
MDWQTYVKAHIKDMKSQLYTTLPAKVVETDKFESEQCITVQLCIDTLDSDGVSLIGPTIYNVPVILPSAGGGLLSFPIQAGDTVAVQFSMLNIESWLEGDGGNVVAPTRRTHSMNDAIAVTGLYTKSTNLNPNPNDVELKFKGNTILLRQNGDVEIETASKYAVRNQSEELIALLSEVLQEVSNITTNTVYGISPINNKPQIQALKTRLDTFKL